MNPRQLFDQYFEKCRDEYPLGIHHPDDIDYFGEKQTPKLPAGRIYRDEFCADSDRPGIIHRFRVLMIGTVLGPLYIVEYPATAGNRLIYKCSPELDAVLGFPDMTVTHEVMNKLISPIGNVNDYLIRTYRILNEVM